MRQRPLDLSKRKQNHGSLSLTSIISPSGRYRMGTYQHTLGICTVYATAKTAIVSTFRNDRLVTEERHDYPTERQISCLCRALLQKTHEPP